MKAMRGTYPLLTEDLIIEILLRLPVSSLLRFKSACLRWHCIIKSRYFVRNHSRLESKSIGLLVYWDGVVLYPIVNSRQKLIYPVYTFSLTRPNETLVRYTDVNHRDLIGPIKGMQGPCNGVFCVLRGDNSLALWNPATRMLRPVPRLHLENYEPCLGVDPSTDNLKIVFIHRILQDPSFAIYNVGNSSWSFIMDESLVDPENWTVRNQFGPAFSNGFCYWMIRDRRTNMYFSVLAYDICNQTFRKIGTPEILKPDVERKLHWYGDSLALSTYQRVGVSDEGCFDTWLMKEQGCWTKISTVSLPFGTFTGVRVWNRNHLLAVFANNLMIHDINSRNTRNVEFRKIENATSWNIFAFPYKESLVAL